MTDFFQTLTDTHDTAIQRIKSMIDVDTVEHQDYKQAATLCKYIFDYENKYELIEEASQYGRFYDNAQDFEALCDTIYHALVDDGDIAFVRVNGMCPTIVFKCRWEIKVEDLLTKDQISCYERLNEFKTKKGILPLHEHTLVFYNNAYEYIQAVEDYKQEEIEKRRQVEQFIVSKRLANRTPANLDDVDFGTTHMQEV